MALRLTPDLIAEINATSPQPRCEVTMFHLPKIGRGIGNGTGAMVYPTCGQPARRYGLCAKHYADRMRLGGAA